MKLLIVTTSYPANDGDPSGHFVRTEARALARQANHDVHVVAPGGSFGDKPDVDPEAPALVVHRVGGGSLFGWPGAVARARASPRRLLHVIPFAARARAAILRIGPVDRAVAHWIVPSAVPLLIGHGAPLDVVAHGADVRLLVAMPAPLRAFVVRSLLDRSATFRFAARASLDALSRALAEPLGSHLAAASRVEPVPLDLPDVSASAAAFRRALAREVRPGKLVVVAGRLIASKRVDLAIDAARIAGASLVVVGDGPLRAALVRLAEERGVDARFTGLVPRADALAWIAAADVVVFPSEAEAAPTVVREARALGVPVVACAAGDVAAWAARDPGIHLVPPDPRLIASALVGAVHQNENERMSCNPSRFR